METILESVDKSPQILECHIKNVPEKLSLKNQIHL